MFPNNSQQQQNVRTNIFNEPEILKKATQVMNKKTGSLVAGCYKAYFEIGGQLFKVETSNSNKESKDGRPTIWIKITKKVKRASVKF
jgi:hypothetical protein